MLRTWLPKKRVWIPLTIVACYALFGFFVLPGILRTQIVEGIRKNTGRQARLDRVRVNPLILSLTLEGFELKDQDGTPFVSWDRMYADVQVSSLVRWALTFREFRLDGPHLHVRLMPNGELNFADLIPKEEGKPPRLIIGSFQIHEGAARVTNTNSPEPEDVSVTPIDLTLENFTTIPEREGEYRITATDPGGGSWKWAGDLTFEPMHSAGVLEVSGTQLHKLWELMKHRIRFEISDGLLACRLQYRVDAHGDSLVARVDSSWVAVTGFALRQQGAEPELLRLDTLTVSGVELAYPEQTAGIRRVLLAGVRAQAWLNPDSTLNWASMLIPGRPMARALGTAAGVSTTPSAAPDTSAAVRAGAPSTAPAAPAPEPWDVTLDELALRNLNVAFEDRTIDPPFNVTVAPVNATLRHIKSRPGTPVEIQTDVTIAERGKLDVSGTVVTQPLTVDLAVRLADFPLPIFQPYMKGRANLQIVSGTVGISGDVTVHQLPPAANQPATAPPALDVAFKGNVQSRNLLTRDRKDNERFLAWKSVDVEAIDFTPARVSVGAVKLDQPYGKIVIHKDRTTNLQDILGIPTVDTVATPVAEEPKANKKGKQSKPPPPKNSEALAAMQQGAAAAQPQVPVKIGAVQVVDGSADFADLSLILPFAARIEHLAGTVKGLSSDSSARAAVVLDGRIQPSGSAKVRGELNPLARDVFLDLAVVFDNVSMPVLTPYGGTFLGREIDKGNMSLDLGYKLQGRHLVGENKIVLDQLELGEKVDSPEATHLPVGLAIAILKDKDGKIDLDVPVEGDLDDPKFRIGRIIWEFILSLLTKVATAPFALLGSLFGGGGGEELSHVEFAAGSSAVATDQQESLTKLAEVLAKRPQLGLEVRGESDDQLDAEAIRKVKFETLAGERMASNPKRYGSGLGYSTRLLEELYTERFGKQALRGLEDGHRVTAGTLPPADPRYKAGSKKEVVDEAAMGAAIQDTLIAVQPIDASEMLTLANARATAVKTQLIAQGVEESRVYVLDPQPGKVEDGKIRLDLALKD